jgi:TIR domain
MNEAKRAVFLSYASEDADAALRICNALRVRGIEVWFDQSELRGGDAWDAMIRWQVKACALFIAIISSNWLPGTACPGRSGASGRRRASILAGSSLQRGRATRTRIRAIAPCCRWQN